MLFTMVIIKGVYTRREVSSEEDWDKLYIYELLFIVNAFYFNVLF